MIMSLEPAGEEQEKFRSNFKVMSRSFAALPFKIPGTAFYRGIKVIQKLYIIYIYISAECIVVYCYYFSNKTI